LSHVNLNIVYEKIYKKEQTRINNKLAKLFLKNKPDSLYDPCKYIMNNGGKRLRPLLVLFSKLAVTGSMKGAYNAALAVEILHNFTLVHDDIMDKSSLRRGRETVHLKYDPNAAILAGDNLIGVAYKTLIKDCDNSCTSIVNSFTNAIIEVCEGQSYDTEYERRKNVTVDEYLVMIRKKTAVLLEACCEIGGTLGNGSPQQIKALKQYGMNIGMAFQFQDDLLDIMGEEKKFGKPIGADLLEGKKTYMFLKAYEKARGKEKKALREIIEKKGTSKQKIDYYREIYLKLGVIEEAKKEIENYTRKALNSIKKIENEEAVKLFTWLAYSLIKRNY
jgi:geranylgeranyl diphosphate synthase, type II